jgi:hypothetical protein
VAGLGRNAHDDDITFTTVMPIYIEEFFADFVLRKVMVEPHEYIRWLPALKLFTTFLFEIGYEQNPVRIITLLDRIEPHFLEILQKRYS